MKLKTIKYFLLAIFLFGFFTGCEENFLEVKNPNQATPDTFWESKTNAEKALGAAYSHAQAQVWDGSWGAYEMWVLRTCRSDLIDLVNMWYPFGDMSKFQASPNGYAIRNYWEYHYQGLLAANQILENMDKVPTDEATIKQFKAEAKFLRAYYHYNLITNFGNIVLRDATPKTGSEYSLTQSTQAEVWAHIQKDLTEAIPDLPKSYASDWKGRATEGAARMLLAKALMFEDKWTDAETHLKAITGLGYELISDYESMFNGLNEWNNESIFEINYSLDLTGGAIETIAIALMKTYKERMEGPSAYMLGLYDKDKQSDGSPSKRAAASVKEENGAKMWKKYTYYDENTNKGKSIRYSGTNLVIMRYADALLLLAETLNEQGKTSEAIGYVNQVRNRSGVADLSGSMSQSDLREHIRHVERPLELADEGNRWYDLIRWYKDGSLKNVLQAHGREAAENFEVHDRFYPIPGREISYNPNIKQNPGF